MGLLFLESTERGEESEEKGQRCISAREHGAFQTAGSELASGGGGGALTIVKVEAVEVHPLHQVAEALGLKRGQARVADLPVGRCTRASWQSNGCRPR